MPDGSVNNSGCGKDTACCDTCNRAIGETCTGAGDVCCDGATCCGDGCRDTNFDENNCGECGHVCGTGLTCCSGQCVDLLTDVNNCTECGNACPTSLPNASVSCGKGLDDNGQEGRGCVFTCFGAFRDCNDDPADGCEVDIDTNDNCGTCSPTNCAATPGNICVGCKCGAPGTGSICQPVGNARLIRRGCC
jgi:hypothetical protein